ncbi:hypothetical protein NDU88_003661 [Pleurodeles waltl]|uniref:Uncharacterized protein n=1 Tax=Pleurodeles waltl TaxID=8319 RepID=A0AAV7MZ78_PLEWA|nr:hypothetical protein NDU88_003661 [Pleurodeles waltl]
MGPQGSPHPKVRSSLIRQSAELQLAKQGPQPKSPGRPASPQGPAARLSSRPGPAAANRRHVCLRGP